MLRRKGERIEVEGIETTASSRILSAGKHVLPVIEVTFRTPDKDVIVVQLPAAVAAKLADDLIISLRVALPKIPRRRGTRYE